MSLLNTPNLNIGPCDLLSPIFSFNNFIHKAGEDTDLWDAVEDEEYADPCHHMLGVVTSYHQGGHQAGQEEDKTRGKGNTAGYHKLRCYWLKYSNVTRSSD